MAIPKFLVGDNTDHPESVYLIHTEFPRFVMDLDTDEIEWLDDVDGEDEADLTDEMAKLLGELRPSTSAKSTATKTSKTKY